MKSMAKKILIYFLLIPIFVFSSFLFVKNIDAVDVDRYYKIGFNFSIDNGLQIDHYDITTVLGYRDLNAIPGDYLAKLYSFDNELLLESYFTTNDKSHFYLELPYRPTGRMVEIFKGNNKILEKNIQIFAQTCGDGKCQKHEDYKICSEDCMTGGDDKVCDGIEDGICDPNCSNIKELDSDCTGESREKKLAQLRDEIIEKKKLSGEQEKSVVAATVSEKPFFKVFIFFIILVITALFLIVFLIFKKRE